MTREPLYVAMTRGRHANSTYVVTADADPNLEQHAQPSAEPLTAQQVLCHVLANEGAERSATEQLQRRLINSGVTQTQARHHSTCRPSHRSDLLPETTMSVGR
jgi:hypothetical protein